MDRRGPDRTPGCRFSWTPRTLTAYQAGEDEPKGEVIFRCSEALASSLVADWQLPVSVTELMELPPGTAIARLPGMTVALKTNDE